MATLRRSPLFRMLLLTALGSVVLMTALPGLAFGLPLVAITRPTQGATVSGVIWIDVAFRSDSNRPITRLEIYIDDALTREVDLATPMLEGRQSFNWDFSYAQATTHKIAARAIDSANAANSAFITVQVQNAAVGGPDVIPPVVRIYYPAQGAKLQGQVEIKAEANDNVGVELVYFYVDGRLHKMMMNAPPYVDSWDTRRDADGVHVLEAVAVDAAELEARSAQVTVIVENHSLTTMAGTAGSPVAQGLGTAPGTPAPGGAAVAAGGVAPPPAPAPAVEAALPAPAPAVSPAPGVAPAPSVNPAQPATRVEVKAPEPWDPLKSPVLREQPKTVAGGAPKLPDVDPLLPVGTRVVEITPRVAPAGPLPGAPVTDNLLPLGSPVGIGATHDDQLTTTPPAGAPRTSTPDLSRPGAGSALPGGAALAASSPKVSPAAGREPAQSPAQRSTLAVSRPPVPEPVKVAQPAQPVRMANAPDRGSATLSPANAAAPQLAPAGRADVGLAKSTAPLGALSVTPSGRTTVPSSIPTAAATPVRPSGLERVAAVPASPAAPKAQKVTPLGPAVAMQPAPREVRPLVNLIPDHKATPSSGLSRITPPAPVKSPEQVASVTRPPVSSAVLTQAALAEYRGLPVPASRMLAMLPNADSAKLPADGRITRPTDTAAVPLAVAAVRDIKIVFDGEVLSLRTAPETRRGISLAPLREIFEKTDGVLYWFPVEGQVRAVNKDVDVKLKIGDRKVSVNGEAETLQIAPYIKQGRTMVPLQFIADVLDVKIAFDNGTGQILISSNQF